MIKEKGDVMVCNISCSDILDFKPIMPTSELNPLNARYELIKSFYPDAPIEGFILLKIKNGWTCELMARPDDNSIDYIFTKESHER